MNYQTFKELCKYVAQYVVKIVRKDRTSTYKKIKIVEKENKLLKQKSDIYRKTYSPLLKKYKPGDTNSPKVN